MCSVSAHSAHRTIPASRLATAPWLCIHVPHLPTVAYIIRIQHYRIHSIDARGLPRRGPGLVWRGARPRSSSGPAASDGNPPRPAISDSTAFSSVRSSKRPTWSSVDRTERATPCPGHADVTGWAWLRGFAISLRLLRRTASHLGLRTVPLVDNQGNGRPSICIPKGRTRWRRNVEESKDKERKGQGTAGGKERMQGNLPMDKSTVPEGARLEGTTSTKVCGG